MSALPMSLRSHRVCVVVASALPPRRLASALLLRRLASALPPDLLSRRVCVVAASALQPRRVCAILAIVKLNFGELKNQIY